MAELARPTRPDFVIAIALDGIHYKVMKAGLHYTMYDFLMTSPKINYILAHNRKAVFRLVKVASGKIMAQRGPRR